MTSRRQRAPNAAPNTASFNVTAHLAGCCTVGRPLAVAAHEPASRVRLATAGTEHEGDVSTMSDGTAVRATLQPQVAVLASKAVTLCLSR